jgi:cytosine deaminase
MGEAPSLVLGGVTLPDGRLADVAVSGDRISAVTEPAEPAAAEAGARVELRGHLLLPAPAEPHAHLDKVLTAGLIENATGDLEGAVESWYRFRATAPHRDIADRALEACLRMLGHGCTAVRTHLESAPGPACASSTRSWKPGRSCAGGCTWRSPLSSTCPPRGGRAQATWRCWPRR